MKKLSGLMLRPRHSRWMAAVPLLIGLLVNRSKRSKPEKIAERLYAGLPPFCREALGAEDQAVLLALLRAGARFLSRLTSL